MRFLKLLVRRVTVKGKRKDTRRWAHAWPRQKFERELQLCLHGLASSYDLKLPPPRTTPAGYHPASLGKGGNQPASPGKRGTQPASPSSRGSSRTASAKWGSQSTKSQSTGWSTKSTPSLLRATTAAGRRKEGSQPGSSGDNQPTSGGGNQPTSKSSSTASDEHGERPAPLACSAPHVPPAAPAAPATSAAPADSADPADSVAWQRARSVGGILRRASGASWSLNGCTDGESLRRALHTQLLAASLRDIDLYVVLTEGDTHKLTVERWIRALTLHHGYNGNESVLRDVFRRFDTDASGVVSMGELHAWLAGRTMRTTQAAEVHLLHAAPEGAPRLTQMEWSVESMRGAIQAMLRRGQLAPLDLLRAYDKSQDGEFSLKE